MKYFNNFPYTIESLKAEYRTLAKKLHPDTGGNDEEFKAMHAEYEQTAADLERANQRAAREAEEAREREAARRRAEEERREEEARKAAARPEYERRARKWAGIMEDLKKYREAEEAACSAYGYSSQQAKAARCTFRSARRRNLVAMAKKAFPGVKFSASINTGWGGGAEITWTDGPTVEEFEAATDYDLFVSGWDTFDGMTDCADYERADFTDFAEKYGQFSGRVKYDRKNSEEHRQAVSDLICQIRPEAAELRAKDGRRENNDLILDDSEIKDICRRLNIDFERFRAKYQYFGDWGLRSYNCWVGWFASCSHYEPQAKEQNAPEFAPKYGPTYKAIKKALSGNVFGYRKTGEIVDIFALCGDLERLEIGKISTWEGKKEFSGMYRSNYKNTTARRQNLAAVGVTLDGNGCKVVEVSEEIREALRREAQDIEEQRRAWEAEQNGEKSAKPRKERKAAGPKPDNQTAADTTAAGVDPDEAPAAGLHLQDIPGGVAIIGDEWKDTYFNKKQIRAHGASWNKERKQWEATDPADVVRLRAWFALRDGFGVDPDTLQDTGEIKAEAEQQAEEAAAGPEPSEQAGPKAAPELSPFMAAAAEMLATFARIISEAQRWRGVTIPAATLERWRTETERGTTQAAALFAEVCACLGSLTPESREQFDGLGVIFWTLAEKLRNGYNPDTIRPATDYARAQLWDLIDRTQNEAQARAVREAMTPAA